MEDDEYLALDDVFKGYPVVADDDTSTVGEAAGLPVATWVVLGFLILGIPMAAVIFWFSFAQERCANRRKRSKRSDCKGEGEWPDSSNSCKRPI